MARLPFLAGIAAAAALGLAAYLFWQDLRPATEAAAQPVQIASAAPEADAPPSEPAPRTAWPALFGEPQPPAPLAAPAAQTTPEAQPAPPLSGMGYSLVGLFESGAGKWAIIAHPTGSTLVREGDTLAPGLEVAEITAEGIWVGQEPARQFLAFPEQ